MCNHKLRIGIALGLCDLAGCAGQQEQVLRERQDQDAEGRKFGGQTGTPARANCRMALRVIESIERTPRSPPGPTRWHEAQALEFGRDGAGQREPEERGHGWARETRCNGISAGQSVVLDCGFDMPIADFLAGLDR